MREYATTLSLGKRSGRFVRKEIRDDLVKANKSLITEMEGGVSLLYIKEYQIDNA